MEKFKDYVKMSIEKYESLKVDRNKLDHLLNGGTLKTYRGCGYWGTYNCFSVEDKEILLDNERLQKELRELRESIYKKVTYKGVWTEFKIALTRIPI